ncbi:hypothetical protein lerEdw1_012177 [Lerista edwardsae]|nr:hypothetical protein lerEdw1_012177 [Lerista edwardsae]
MFTAILKKSIRNLQICTEVGLVEHVLQRIDKANNMIADLLVDMLGVLASYSVTVRELKLYFSKFQGEKGKWPPHAGKLLSVLKHMPQKYGPDAFFNFPGKSAAAIALPPIAKWPYQNGFTFHTWLRMDPVNNINVDKDKPYLYCFRTSKGLGYSAHFVGGCLVVTSIKSKGKGFQHCVKFDFKPQKWYMVSIVHIYNRWKNSELRCYVNGELASYGEITWFVNTSDTFDKCFLGSSETADANRVFCGQMTAVYLFSEALNAAQIFAIYQLGLGYKGTFKFKGESDRFLADHHKLLLYDGKLSNAIAFTYNPRATDAQLCLESSPKDNPSIFVHSPHALMLQDVKAVVTHSIQSAMHSIGGVQVLFPLFAQLDYTQYSLDQPDTTVCSILLAFIMELLKNSIAMQEQMLSCKGFLVIGYSLEKCGNVEHVLLLFLQSSKAHISRAVLELCLAFAKYLSNLHNGMPLLKQLCDHILLNPAIWIHTPAKVQLILYTYLSTEFVGTANIYNAIRRVGTVLLAMHTLKYYYWVVNPQDRSGIIPKGLDGPRPNQKEILTLRAFLLMFVKQLVMKDHGVKEDELQGILNYLLTIHEDDNLMDVLQLLVALMSEHPTSMIPAFDQRNGLRVVYKLLASKSEGIRVQALKVMGYFLKHLAPKRKAEVMLGHGLFSLLGERLMLQTTTITMTTYNVLFEMLIEQICTQVIHKQHPDPDSTVKIQNPQVLKVIATLLRNSARCPETMEVHRVFLSDMIKLFNNSRDNRRSLLQCSVWQEWMLSLCYFNPKSSDEQKITEMVYAIFRILLYHAVKYEWGGWRVWVDTLAITHSKVTFEMHKESLSQMFREYQEKGDEDCDAGPSILVRTISGTNRETEVAGRRQQLEIKEAGTSVCVGNGSVDNNSLTAEDRPAHCEEQASSEVNVERSTERENGQRTPDLNKASCLELRPQIEAEKPSSEATSEITGAIHEEEMAAAVDAISSAQIDGETLESPEILEKLTPDVEEEEDFVDLKEESNMPFTSAESAPLSGEELTESPEALAIQPETAMLKESVIEALEPKGTEELVKEEQNSMPETSASEIKDATTQPNSNAVEKIDEKNTDQPQTKATVGDAQPCSAEALVASEKKIAKLDVSSVASDTERLELKSNASLEVNQPLRSIPEYSEMFPFQLQLDLFLYDFVKTSRQQDSSSQGTGAVSDGQRRDSRSTMFRIPEFRWSQMHQRLLTDLLFSIETDVQMWRSHSTKTVMDFVNSSDNVIFVHNTIHLLSQVMDNMIMACGGILPLLSAATSATHELENIEPTQGLSIEASVAFLQRLISLVDVLIFASSLGFTEIEAEKNMSSGGILRQCLRLDVDNPPPAHTTLTPVSTEESEIAASVQRRDSGIEEEAQSGLEHNSETAAEAEAQCVSAGPDAISEVLCTLSSEVNRSQESKSEVPSEMDSQVASAPPTSKNVNVKDILRSLVSAPADGTTVDHTVLPSAFLGVLGDGAAEQPVQFRSFDRIVVVPPKKSVASSTATINVPTNAVSVVSSLDSAQAPDVTGGSPGSGSSNSRLPSVPTVSSVPEDSASNMSITERLEHALEKAAPLLREIFVDFAPFLSRTLLGSHGQELLIEGTTIAQLIAFKSKMSSSLWCYGSCFVTKQEKKVFRITCQAAEFLDG